MRRLAAGLYSVATLLLPGWLRASAGKEMRELFARRQAEIAEVGGRRALPAFWLRESWGLVRTAYGARRPPRWARRTAPVGSADLVADATSGPTLQTLRSDMGFLLRTVRRRPAGPLLCVLTLSLGIGASTAMFGVVESVLLRPLPYPEADRLVSVYAGWPERRGHPTLGGLAERGSLSWPEVFAIEERQTVFEQMAAYQEVGMTLTEDGPPEQVLGASATWEQFPMLGATPVLGRLFDAGDTGDSRVVVLSHGAWVGRFGADPDIIGRRLTLGDEERYTIVGVLPADFELYDVDPVLWTVMTGSPESGNIGVHGQTRTIAQLVDGVTLEEAAEQLTGIFAEILPPGHGQHVGSLFPRRHEESRVARPTILIMLGASLLLLVVACGNAAALLLGAGIDRERELALRGAVGASRGRIATQLLTESTVLGLVAAGGGVVAAVGLKNVLLWMTPGAVPGLGDAALNGAVLTFATLTAAACGIAAGMAPALGLSSVHIAGAMGSGRTTTTKRARLQSVVVVGELALATVLTAAALLLGRTVTELNRIDPGFELDRLAVVALAVPDERFRTPEGATDLNAEAAYLRRMGEEVAALPGVVAVANTSVPPLTGARSNNAVTPDAWPPAAEPPAAERRFVSHDFFATAGIQIVEGRGFERSDYPTEYVISDDWAREEAPWVVVVSEGLARLGWPGQSPLGRTLGVEGLRATVVGVAATVNDESLNLPTELAYYFLLDDGPMLVRTAGDPAALMPAIRERIFEVDPTVPVTMATPMTELVAAEIRTERYQTRLMTMFGVFAAVLALMGIYGVTSRSVARRTHELGVRLALGAKQVSLHRMVMTGAVRLAVAGVAVGILLVVAGSRIIESFLWGVSAVDPLTLVAVIVGFPAFAALAALGPSRRATRVDPLEVLKAE